MAIKGFLLVVLFWGFCAPPLVRYFWVFVRPHWGMPHRSTVLHRDTDTQIPRYLETQTYRMSLTSASVSRSGFL